jgi:putative membrane protein
MKKLFIAFSVCAVAVACNNQSDSTGSGNADSMQGSGQDTAMQNNRSSGSDTMSTSQSGSQGNTEMNDTDREFVMKAGMGNTAEVEAGTMAQQKGSSAGVKDFGSQMVRDHGDAQSKLKAAVGSGASVPDSVDKEHKAMATKLNGLDGTKFDQEYIKGQIKDHKETIALFEKEVSNGSNSALKAFAQNTLPHLKMHLEKVQGLSSGNATNK